jgi:hypothetical protein
VIWLQKHELCLHFCAGWLNVVQEKETNCSVTNIPCCLDVKHWTNFLFIFAGTSLHRRTFKQAGSLWICKVILLAGSFQIGSMFYIGKGQSRGHSSVFKHEELRLLPLFLGPQTEEHPPDILSIETRMWSTWIKKKPISWPVLQHAFCSMVW